MKRILLSALLLVVLPAGTRAAGLTPALEEHFSTLQADELVKVLVVLEDQADTKQLDQDLYLREAPLAERHRLVVEGLRKAAQRTQPGFLKGLEEARAKGGVRGYAPYWIVNAVMVTATVDEVRRLAELPEVRRIEPDLVIELMEPVSVKKAPVPPRDAKGVYTVPSLVTIGAVRVWSELGIDGTGSIVANLDSGVDGTHPALASRWQGNFAPVSQCWQDHAGVGSPDFPVDDFGHGTHVMGTITGATLFEQVGVAPGAHWIASNGIGFQSHEQFANDVLDAFQWFADPDGDPTTTDDVPDVIQNSWGVGPSVGGFPYCDSTWWEVIDNCEAAGVVVVFSAGNDGPIPQSVRPPGDRASSPTSNFSVGSVATSPPYEVSWFSSRGPSSCGGPYATKPEVMAPGQDILSSVPGNAFGYMSGTSMAGPHVAGIVALMRQANPDVDVTTIKEILMETAIDLGLPGEDNTYGYGLVDAYQAVLTVLNEVGSITGTISDADTGTPLEGVRVDLVGSSGESVTDAQGHYRFGIRAGEITLDLGLFGYAGRRETVPLQPGQEIVADFTLVHLPSAPLEGVVRGPDGAPHEGATVAVLGQPVAAQLTGADGRYSFLLPMGEGVSYLLKATAEGLAYDLRLIGFDTPRELDFQLPEPRMDGFENANFLTLPWQHSGDKSWTISNEEAEEGLLSARPGAIAHGQTSTLSLDYYVNGPGELSFWVKTESEIVYDRLGFRVDGELLGEWSGQEGWTRFVTQLETGMHHFEWKYRKDGSVSIDRDTAWIDALMLPGTGVQPLPQLSLSQQFVRAEVGLDEQTTLPVVLRNRGNATLEYSAVLVDPQSGLPVSWGTASPSSGTIEPGTERPLTLDLDGSVTGAGTHRAQLEIDTNDPLQAQALVTVEFLVGTVTGTRELLHRRAGIRSITPNPFNPRTRIVFDLPRAGHTELVVYSVAGRRVRTLLAGELEAGEHQIQWDGRDADGREVASGIYLARLRTIEGDDVRRMALVR